MPSETPAFYYDAIEELSDGQRIAETFTSNVEYLAGDELPLNSARWTVEYVDRRGTKKIDGHDVNARALRCTLG
jgi:hypothetical protein